MMKKVFLLIGMFLLLVLWVLMRNGVAEKPAGSTPVQVSGSAPKTENEVDQTVLEAALETPEAFHQTEPAKEGLLDQKLAAYADLSGRPSQMSERQNVQQKERVAGVNTNTPKFMNSFSSLRKDDVRNPDSEQNRAAVISLMKKRQNRVSQLEKKVEM